MLSVRRLSIGAAIAVLLLGIAGLGIGGIQLRGRVSHALAATTPVAAQIAAHDLPAACDSLMRAGRAWEDVSSLSRPLTPVLHRLGWVPWTGRELRIAPDAIALAQETSAAGAIGCSLGSPILQAPSGPHRIALAVRHLNQHPRELARMLEHLRRAEAAWTRLEPQIDHSAQLAPYRPQIKRLGEQLPTVIRGLEMAQRVTPELPWLLGLDAPRRYLVVLQNAFELRATGGFMGVLCVIRVVKAAPAIDGCRPSEAYTTPAPDISTMPFPYARYLRLGNYFLRDANWSPDFPTAARNLEYFWSLNGQPAVDGVIAVDPHAFVPLLEAIGPMLLDDGAQLDADNILETLLARYYDGEVFRDKAGLGGLLPQVIGRLLQIDLPALPKLAMALQSMAAEQHLLAVVNNGGVAGLLADAGWDGSIPTVTGDSLRVIESDVGYGGVNAFVDRLTQYDVELDASAAPLTATLTLTWTNRYSPWAEAPTAHSVNGQCADPHTLKLERRPGCYGVYVRVYGPRGSRLIAADGFEEPVAPDERYNRTVFGGYLRIMPGAQQVVRLQYLLPTVLPGSLSIEKQAGTTGLPVLVRLHSNASYAERLLTMRTNRRVTFRSGAQGPAIDGTDDREAAAAFASHRAFVGGLASWEQGAHIAAIHTWRQAGVLDRALDHARLRAADGAPAEGLAIVAAIAEAVPSGRSAFEHATLLEAQGDMASADTFYRLAAERSPDNPLAQITWAKRLVAIGQPMPHGQQVPLSPAALRRWRRAAIELHHAGQLSDAIAELKALVRVAPADHEAGLYLADLLLKSGWRDDALARYADLSSQGDPWGGLAGARRAEMEGRPEEAVTLYKRVLPHAATQALALRVGDGLRDAGDRSGALQAYEQAAALPPPTIWPLMAAGNMLRASDVAAARGLYQRAQRVEPSSGYPDFALGTLLLEAGDFAAAIPLLHAAVTKEPDVKAFREKLDQVVPRAEAHTTPAPVQMP